MTANFPYGKYEILIGDTLKEEDLTFSDNIFHYKGDPIHGVGHCTVLPPKNIKYPVLLCTIKKHTFATLCYACAKVSRAKCKCSNKKRQCAAVGYDAA